MTYPILKLILPHEAMEATVGVLARFHYTSLWEEVVGDQTTLRVCFSSACTPASLRACRDACVATNPREISGTIEMVPPYDWSNQWKEFFQPIDLGGGIVVCADDSPKDPPHPGRQTTGGPPSPPAGRGRLRKIFIQPGMAFGTGQHATTQLVAHAIATHYPRRRWPRMLDIGTGSGILAMVAVASGVAAVDATDIDPEAVRVARENIVINRMAETIQIHDALDACQGPYDCIVANILLEPLRQLASAIAERLKPDGDCFLSGILIEQAAILAAAYSAVGLTVAAPVTCGEWAMLHCRKSATT